LNTSDHTRESGVVFVPPLERRDRERLKVIKVAHDSSQDPEPRSVAADHAVSRIGLEAANIAANLLEATQRSVEQELKFGIRPSFGCFDQMLPTRLKLSQSCVEIPVHDPCPRRRAAA
jgi:hypothetical protein